MKQLAISILLFLSLLNSFSLEIGGAFGIENLAFMPNREQADASFTGLDYPVGFSLFVEEDFSDDTSFRTEYKYDNILRNVLTSLFTYSGSFYRFGVGPFFGFLNTEQIIPKIGISSFFRLEWPGFIYGEMSLVSSLNNQLLEDGNYLQEYSLLSFGIHVSHAICSLNILSKTFTQRRDSINIADSISEYSIVADVFEKNIPYRIELSLAFQDLSKSFIDDDTVVALHTLYSLILGVELNLNFREGFDIILDLESSIYSFGMNQLAGISNPGAYLFRLTTGFTLDLAKLLE